VTHRRSGYDNSNCCSAYRKGVRTCCTIHYISVKNIEKVLFAAIRRVVCYVRDNDKDFVEKVRAASVLRAENAVKESKRTLAKSKRRVDELDTLIRKLNEDNASGKIPDRHFNKMFAEYDAEQTTLEAKIVELQTEVDRFAADSVKADNFIDLARRHTEFEKLTPQILNEFISRVEIYEKDKEGDKVTQKVDIYFNFIGGFVVPDDYDEYSPEERIALNVSGLTARTPMKRSAGAESIGAIGTSKTTPRKRLWLTLSRRSRNPNGRMTKPLSRRRKPPSAKSARSICASTDANNLRRRKPPALPPQSRRNLFPCG
jgi:hypothetical protein